MAGGDDAKWTRMGGQGRRHFAPVLGEPLIHRTIRQLRANGVTDIGIICPPDMPEYDIKGTWRIKPTTCEWGHEALNGREHWSDTERTIQVFGDVVFSPLAMSIICGYRPRRFQAFGYIRGKSGELFAISFWPEGREAWENAVRLGFRLKANGIIKRAGSWEGYRIMGGARGPYVAQHRIYLRQFTNIRDGTDDTDSPAKYEKMVTLAKRRRWK